MTRDEIIMICTCDLGGQVRGKGFPASDLAARLRRGIGWTPTNSMITAHGPIAPSPWGPFGDLVLMPDPDTEVRVDMGEAHAAEHFLLADICHLDGTPWAVCPRGFLKRVLAALEARHGLGVRAAFEHEFIYEAVAERPNSSYALDAFRRQDAFAETYLGALREAGLTLDTFMPEYGPMQYEVTVGPAVGVRAADQAVAVREIARSVADRMGSRVSFTPILRPDAVGNGVHVHFSLFRTADEAPVDHDPGHPHGVSAIAGSFLAGILAKMPAIAAVTAAASVSYLRLCGSSLVYVGVPTKAIASVCLGLLTLVTVVSVRRLPRALASYAWPLGVAIVAIVFASLPALAEGDWGVKTLSNVDPYVWVSQARSLLDGIPGGGASLHPDAIAYDRIQDEHWPTGLPVTLAGVAWITGSDPVDIYGAFAASWAALLGLAVFFCARGTLMWSAGLSFAAGALTGANGYLIFGTYFGWQAQAALATFGVLSAYCFRVALDAGALSRERWLAGTFAAAGLATYGWTYVTYAGLIAAILLGFLVMHGIGLGGGQPLFWRDSVSLWRSLVSCRSCSSFDRWGFGHGDDHRRSCARGQATIRRFLQTRSAWFPERLRFDSELPTGGLSSPLSWSSPQWPSSPAGSPD